MQRNLAGAWEAALGRKRLEGEEEKELWIWL
jgi:hypothetical protein